MELDLACSLQVVHVPRVIMINQGADGLSRGIWMSALHLLADQHTLTRAIFDPLLPCSCLVNKVLSDFLGPCQWFRNWEDQWDGRSVFGRLTVWFPPLEIARQVITFVLESWVECPRNTSALFFIPRTVPAFWFGFIPLYRGSDHPASTSVTASNPRYTPNSGCCLISPPSPARSLS
jgi:hypothetical protein